MTRVFQPHIITDDSAVGGHIIPGSFITDGDVYFSRTGSTDGNRKAFTLSMWYRPIRDTAENWLFGCGNTSNPREGFQHTSEKFYLSTNTGSGSLYKFDHNSLVRDQGGWYHLVVVFDSCNPTQSDRLRFYINGNRDTNYGSVTYPSLDQNTQFINDVSYPYVLLALPGVTNSFVHGNVTQYHFFDGATLDQSYFGYTDELTGIWRPKKVKTDVNNGYTYGSSTTTSPSGTWTASGNGWGSHPPSHIFDNNYTNFMNNSAGGQIITWNTTTYNLRGKLEIECYGDPYDIYVNGNSTKVADAPSGTTYTKVDCGTHSVINEIQFAGTSYNTGTGLGSAGIYVRAIYVNGVQLKNGATNDHGLNGFFLPFDGTHPVLEDISGNNNHFNAIYDKVGSLGPSLDQATGAFPILRTDTGGRNALMGVRDDPLKSYISFAHPLDNPNVIDYSAVVRGSGTGHSITYTNTGLGENEQNYTNSTSQNFYGSCVSFNGSSSRCDIPSSSDFDIGTGDFTCEAYINLDNSGSGNRVGSVVFNKSTSSASSNSSFYFGCGSNGVSLYLSTTGSSWTTWIEVSRTFNGRLWHHIVWQRRSNILEIFIDGMKQTSYAANQNNTIEQDVFTSTRQANIGTQDGSGSYFKGYIQDLRFYKGVAKYTSNFVPGFSQPRITKDSPSGFAHPKLPDYSSVTNGSVSFTGDNQYLIIPNHSDFDIGLNEFTMECWVYNTFDGQAYPSLIQKYDTDSNASWFWALGNSRRMNQFFFYYAGGAAASVGGTDDVPLRKWTHCAVVRDNNTLRTYVNGVQTATVGVSASDPMKTTTMSVTIGADSNGAYDLRGYISNARIINGTCLYPNGTTFTPQLTNPLTNVTNTKLLCCQDPDDFSTAAVIPTGSITRSDNAKGTRFNPFDIVDTCSSAGSNFPTLSRDSNHQGGGWDITDWHKNLRAIGSVGDRQISCGKIMPSSGKYYFECNIQQLNVGARYFGVGLIWSSSSAPYQNPSIDNNNFRYITASGDLKTTSSGTTNWSTGYRGNVRETFCFAVDMDRGEMYFGIDGIWVTNANPHKMENPHVTDLNTYDGGLQVGGGWYPVMAVWQSGNAGEFNFGDVPFKYMPPEGFLSLASCSQPKGSVLNPKKHFTAVSYQGNGSSDGDNQNITLDFTPDLVYITGRENATHKQVFTSLTTSKALATSRNVGEYSFSAMQIKPSSFDAPYSSSSSYTCNTNGHNYMAYCWKAGGAAVANTDGTISSQVSVNKEAGFSIVTYTGTGADGTVGHGLGKVPAVVIIKNRDRTVDWIVKHQKLSSGKILYLNLNSGEDTATGSNNGIIGDLNNASTFSLTRTNNSGNYNNNNVSGENYVAFCYAEIPGYSKFGIYRGNDSSDGVFNDCGFKPATIITAGKNSSDAWVLWDNVRDPDNVGHHRSYPNQATVESTTINNATSMVDFYSNGFKFRGSSDDTNGTGRHYIYMAFAEEPVNTPFGSSSLGR